MITKMQVNTSLVILSLALVGLAGCTPALTPTAQPAAEQPTERPTQPPAVTPAPALPSDWETYTDMGQCPYSISYPPDMAGSSQGIYNVLLSPKSTQAGGLVPNFVYISVIPEDFQSDEPGAIYNYDPAETQTLLSMQVGESKSLREDTDLASSFTYTRLPDAILSNQPAAQAYENTQPWEFPPGTREIRYYLEANGCTYLVGGYMATGDLGQPGVIDEELFDQILATFRLAP